jgi:hypothetical protein
MKQVAVIGTEVTVYIRQYLHTIVSGSAKAVPVDIAEVNVEELRKQYAGVIAPPEWFKSVGLSAARMWGTESPLDLCLFL